MQKTLGQIACEAYAGAELDDYLTSEMTRYGVSSWEAAAQAVRAAVIEECAKRIEGEYGGSIPYSGRFESEIDDARAEVNRELVASIRALKQCPPTSS